MDVMEKNLIFGHNSVNMQFQVLKSLLTWSADFSLIFGPKQNVSFFVVFFQEAIFNLSKIAKMAKNGQKIEKINVGILIFYFCHNVEQRFSHFFFRDPFATGSETPRPLFI